MAIYTCKWCALRDSSPGNVVGGSCPKSPHKQHELMNATEKLEQYVCKYCARRDSSPSNVIGGSCPKSPHPNKAHELLG